MEDSKCHNCEKKLKKRQKKFCSHKCMHESRKKGEKRECKRCGESFYAERYRIENGEGLYCSKKCANSVNSKIYTNKERPILYCCECGNELTKEQNQQAYSKGREKNTFCSRKCFYKSRRKRVKCEFCEKEFSVKKSSNQRFCSKECVTNSQRNKYVTKQCAVCGGKMKINPYKVETKSRCKKCKNISLKRDGSSHLTQEEYEKAHQKFRSRERVRNLDKNYIKGIISKTGIDPKNIPKSLIQVKREHLKIKRLIKSKKNNEKHK